MQNIISIRKYEGSDKEAVLNLLRLNTPQFFAPDEEADFVQYLATEIDLYFVVLYNHTIVGCGGINYSDHQTNGKISWDIFHPDYQGKSLGTQLLQYRIDKLKTIDTIKKITVRTSQVAYQFYEKQGFKIFEVIKDYWAPGFDLYNMEYAAGEAL